MVIRSAEGAAMDLSVTRHDVDGIPVIAVSGEVDVQSVARLATEIELVLDLVPTAVVIDLAEVAFIDSTGLGALMGAHRTLSTLSGTLHVVSPAERVRHIFAATALDTVLRMHPSRGEALAAAGRGASSIGAPGPVPSR